MKDVRNFINVILSSIFLNYIVLSAQRLCRNQLVKNSDSLFSIKYQVNSIKFVIARKSGLIPIYIRILIGRKS